MKIGIVGTGNVARNSYLPFLSSREDVELLYFNRTPKKAEACAAEFGGRVLPSMAALTAEGPDAILVLTRETDRYEAAMQLLEFGPKRLFFEKPLVAMKGQAHVSEDDFFKGAEILRTAEEKGTGTAMIFNYRFFDQTKRAMAVVQDRQFGRVVQVTGLVNYCCWSHAIDLVHYFAGPVERIGALEGSTMRSGMGSEAVDVAVSFLTVGGAAGTLVGSAGTGSEFPLYELTICFENGRLTLRGLDGDLDVLDHRTGVHETFALSRDKSRWDRYHASFARSLTAYLESIRQDSDPPVPGMAGLMELQFEAGFRRAIRRGTLVDVQKEFPLDAGG